MIKRIFSLFFAVLIAFSSVSIVSAVDDAYGVSTVAADDTMSKLDYLIRKFPHGKYWNHMGSSKNNPDGVTDTPCASHSNCNYYGGCSCNSYNGTIQCMGYANQIAFEITGVDRMQYEESSTLDITKLRVGDIIREGGHSVCVTGVNGNKISITDCNYGARCIIRWVTVDRSWFTRVEYVLHCKNNNRTNTNVNFHDAYKTGNPPVVVPPYNDDDEGTTAPTNPSTPAEKGEIWQMEADSSLNIRKSADTAAEVIGSIPADARFNVYEKTADVEYVWARVEYNGTVGYSVLNYATYISGKYRTAELTDLKKSYNSNEGISLTWNELSGADQYNIYLYDTNGNLLDTFMSAENSYTIKDRPAGNYLVSVAATNTLTPSWVVEGVRKAVEVTQVIVKAQSLTLRQTGMLEAGRAGHLTPTILPADTTDKTVIWKSSDAKIATVDANGLVRAIKPGVVVITCTSKQNAKLTASCTVTVRPSSVITQQPTTGTTENSIGLKWTKSTGAAGYYVYRYDTSAGRYVKIAETRNQYYVDRGLKADTKYTYVIRPYAVVGSSRLDGNYKNFIVTTLPSKITGIRQAGSDTGRLKLTWNAPKTDVFGYVVYRYDAKAGKYVWLGVSYTNSYIATDNPATAGKYYVVASVKFSNGLAFSKPSDVLTGITGLDRPAARTISYNNSIRLAWSKVKYATHYQLCRVVNGRSVLIKTLPADVNYYTDANLRSGTDYTYFVRAVRVHNTSLNLYSSYLCIKTKTK